MWATRSQRRSADHGSETKLVSEGCTGAGESGEGLPGGGGRMSRAEEAGMLYLCLTPDHLAEGLNMQVKKPGWEKKKELFELNLQYEMY